MALDFHHRRNRKFSCLTHVMGQSTNIPQLTVVVAGLGALFLLSFPDKAGSRSLRFLTDDEQKCIIMRVNADRGDADLTKFEWKRWAASGKDWKIWAYALIFGSITTVSYALAYFLPIILNLGLGFDTGTSQCLIAPPYAFAGIMVRLYIL